MKPSNTTQRILFALLALVIASLACEQTPKNKIDINNLSTDICQGPRVIITLNDRSTASNNAFSRTLMNSDQTVEIKGRLFCAWEDPYQSERTVGVSQVHLEVLALENQSQAEAFFKDAVEGKAEIIEYCKEDEQCTVIQESITSSRFYYVEQNITGREEGKTLPSYHAGYLISWIDTSEGFLFINLFTDHPEREPGSHYIADTIEIIESYLKNNTSDIYK